MRKEFNPSYWSIIRKGKKYIGCSNHCEHLSEENGKIKCCYFEKEIEGEEDNYHLCKECFEAFCKTKFDVLNMTTCDSTNHFRR